MSSWAAKEILAPIVGHKVSANWSVIIIPTLSNNQHAALKQFCIAIYCRINVCHTINSIPVELLINIASFKI